VRGEERRHGRAAGLPKSGREEIVEILEAFLLAVVAIATAWSRVSGGEVGRASGAA